MDFFLVYSECSGFEKFLSQNEKTTDFFPQILYEAKPILP